MTDKILIEALEFIASGINADSVSVNTARKALADHRSQQEAAEWTIASSWWGQGSQVRMWIVQRGDRQFPFFNISDANYLVGLLNASPAPSESAAKDADRYRWWRNPTTEHDRLRRAALVTTFGADLDTAIDAAMAAALADRERRELKNQKGEAVACSFCGTHSTELPNKMRVIATDHGAICEGCHEIAGRVFKDTAAPSKVEDKG